MYVIFFDKKNLLFCHQNAFNGHQNHQNLNIAKNTVFGTKQLLRAVKVRLNVKRLKA
jgi:hypothetical protein